MSKANFVRVSVLSLAAVLGVACSSDADRTARGDKTPAETARTAGETGRAAVDDTATTAKVKSAMASETRIATLTEINVSTENGVVTLKGNVPSATAKQDAERVARSVEGVTDVRNQLEIKAKSATGREADRSRGDAADRPR